MIPSTMFEANEIPTHSGIYPGRNLTLEVILKIISWSGYVSVRYVPSINVTYVSFRDA